MTDKPQNAKQGKIDKHKLEIMKAISSSTKDKCSTIVVAAMHKDSHEPIFFFKGHVYDAAKLCSIMMQHFKKVINESIG